MSTECQKNVQKMSENVQKLSGGAENAIFGHFLDSFCLLGRHFCLVTLSNARLLQPLVRETRFSFIKYSLLPPRIRRKIGRCWRWGRIGNLLVAHDCGYPLSRYTCRATRVAADFLDFIAFCRCSTGVALHPLKILVSHLPPHVPGGVAPKFGSEKVSRYTGVSQLQLRVSRYTVQLRDSGSRRKAFFSARPATLR